MGKLQSWTEDLIEQRLKAHIEKLGRMPTSVEMRKLDSRLEGAITRSGGFRRWAKRLNRAEEIRHAWSEKEVERRLLPHVKKLGRMPTAPELVDLEGNNKLSVAVTRYGGYRHWGRVFDVPMKDSTTSRGHVWEDHEEVFFLSLGHTVTRQTTKAEFDLLVNGHRVDVKAAKWSEHQLSLPIPGKSAGSWMRGFVFAGLKRGIDCDFFDLLCLENGQLRHRFIIPAIAAQITGLTMTKRQLDGFGKYSAYRDRVDLLAMHPGA